MRVSARLIPFLLVLALSSAAGAQSEAPSAAELNSLLKQFLEAASTLDRQVFDRFFADDVLYTRSAGVTIDKAEILRSLDTPEAQRRAASSYAADQIRVHQYGDTAVVNFRLTARPLNGSPSTFYRNTATFLRRNGRWQAVAWQATRIPEETSGSSASRSD